MKRLTILALMVFAVCLFTAQVLAAEVAFVDMEKIGQLTNKGKETMKKLSAMKDDFELQVRQKELDLKKQQEELETQGSVLTDEAKKTKVEEFQRNVMETQQKAMELQQKFEEYRVKLVRSLVSDIQSVSKQIAVSNGYKIVMLKTEDPTIQLSLVLYGDPSIDLTDQVIKKMNESTPAAPPPAQ